MFKVWFGAAVVLVVLVYLVVVVAAVATWTKDFDDED